MEIISSLRPEHIGIIGMLALLFITSACVVLDCYFDIFSKGDSSSLKKGSITPDGDAPSSLKDSIVTEGVLTE